MSFPKLRPWAEQNMGIDIEYTSPANKTPQEFTEPIKNSKFLESIAGHYYKITFDGKERLFHSHGHTGEDIYRLRYGKFDRIVDAVIWPSKHEEVEHIVKQANEHNVVIIPYGGGTSVSGAVEPPKEETRMIISIDMHEMNHIKWIDYESMLASIECGIIGKDLDAKLAKLGLCLGHEPDSSEFSSLGGWISTRASGMKKNIYGNIEDLVVNVKVVTPSGTYEKGCNVPRISSGPDITQMILGSEGTLGIVTEAILKLRQLPECKKYGSIVFPDFENGVAFMRDVAKQRIAPASIRLVDNLQFQFAQVLKPHANSKVEEIIDAAKKWYVTRYKGFDQNKMTAVTLVFEGNLQDVQLQQKRIYQTCAKYHGLPGGEENGRRGYFLTYMIAYLRDFGLNYNFMAESFETSVPWSNVLEVCTKVKEQIYRSCKEKGVTYNPFVSCRVTQTYDAGACIYFYFGFVYRNLADPLRTYIEIEDEAREEILKYGGSVSHHHGIGKIRKQFLKPTITETGITMLKGLKNSVDPKNIFANNNLI